MHLFNNIYFGRKVLVTGHSGFKGTWLTFWLKSLGAEVCGVSLEPGAHPSAADREYWCDIREPETLAEIFHTFQPEIVFHLAAQALVRKSYREPAATFETNVIGTIHVLEACRSTNSVKAVVCVSSDKCYENRETTVPYKESDPMGGFDPYSASKGAMEIAVASYRRSFFSDGNTLVASARAGNVIGGGDEAEDRLIPDLVRAYRAGRKECLRNPKSVRPWQHVLEPLSGYLMLGERLWSGDRSAAQAWNFGPVNTAPAPVGEVARLFVSVLGGPEPGENPDQNAPHEANLLCLDAGAALRTFGWHGVWDLQTAVTRTAAWYRSEIKTGHGLTEEDLAAYQEAADRQGLPWCR